jgi:hypothetical protein
MDTLRTDLLESLAMMAIRYILIVPFLALVGKPAYAEDQLQYLAAASPVTSKNNSQVVETEFGPGVQHREGKLTDVVIRCSIDANVVNDFCWLQLVAEDNTPNGYATATLWRANTTVPSPAEQLHQVMTTDKPGVRVAFNNNFAVTLDAEDYVYWMEIRIVRTSPDAVVTVYSTALKNVF